MKYIQTGFLKIMAYSILFFSYSFCQGQNEKIKLADSLFKSKQYTQSLEIYQSVFDEHKYSPSMLLRMAYINEGLGKIGATLYFLKLYHLASDDEQVLQKTKELAGKFKLAGYDENDSSRVQRWFYKNTALIQAILALMLFSVTIAIFFQRTQIQKPWGLFVAFILLMSLLFYSNNFFTTETGIVISDKAYLLDGPSAGANVVSTIGEGTLLPLLGQEDVWMQTKWADKQVYLKENSVLKIAL